MQNPIQKFRQSSIIFEKLGILKHWKLWRAPTTIGFNNFCWNFAHVPYLPISKRGYVAFFYLVYNLSYLPESKNTWFLYTHRDQFY